MTGLDHLTGGQRSALDAAVALVRDRYDPWAILAAGTIIRGEVTQNSAIDLYVLHAAPFRQRVQGGFAGTPVEIFVNPEATVLGYFESEQGDRPYTAHMIRTGVAVLDDDPERPERLRERARASLDSSPEWDAAVLVRGRYSAATMIEDALDLRDTDQSQAMRLLCQGVELTLEYWFKRRGEYYPRHKSLLKEVRSRDAELGALCRTFWGEALYAGRFDAGLGIADAVLETRGFFEWESDQESTEAT